MDPDDRPEPPAALAWAETPWRAFMALSAGRNFVTVGQMSPMGGGMLLSKPCPITWEALQTWCDQAGCRGLEREEFVEPLVRVLDREFLEHWARNAVKPVAVPDNKLARWDQAE